MLDRAVSLTPAAWVARLSQIQLVRIDVGVRLHSGFSLSSPLCSVVRGLIGERLRDLRCITRALHCSNCEQQSRCDYFRVFEGHAEAASAGSLTHDFWLQGVPALKRVPNGISFQARLVVAGHALAMVPYLDVSLRDALARLGRTGHDRVHPSGGVELTVSRIEPWRWTPPAATVGWDAVAIEARTPLRLRGSAIEGARMAPRAPEFAILLRAIVRRLDAIMQTFLPGYEPARFAFPNITDAVRLEGAQFERWRESRFSRRQKRRHDLDGLTGTLLVESAALPELAPLLVAAMAFGIGKATAMGFGNVVVRPIRPFRGPEATPGA